MERLRNAFRNTNWLMRLKLPLLETVLALLIFSGHMLSAQLTTGAISGTVFDPTGAMVPGAKVTATNESTRFFRSVQSNADGTYRLEFLPIGDYEVTVVSAGFKTFAEQKITLNLNAELRLDANLRPGETSETVSVSAADLALIQIENATVGRTVDNVEVENLPIVNRNVYDLLALAPGVQANIAGNNLGYPEQRVVINGGYDNGAGSVSYYLDGGINMTTVRNTGNIVPNPDALQEFNVQTNNYNALYGRMSSGLVNVATKSGTNQFHGSAFDFLRNDRLNAANAFISGKTHYHRAQFGATLGGPIWRDKTFFFGSYGGLRLAQSTPYNSAIVPTLAEFNSGFTDFSDRIPTSSGTITASTSCTLTLSVADKAAGNFLICNPTTRKLLSTGGVVNKGVTPDPVALNIIKYLQSDGTLTPGGNGSNGYLPIMQESVPYTQTSDEFLGKVDHQLNPKHRLEVSYFNTPGQNLQLGGGNLKWSALQYTYRQQNANVSDTWTISPNKIDQTYISYTRQAAGRVQTPTKTLTDFGSLFGIQGGPGLPQINVNGNFLLAETIAGPRAGTNFYAVRNVFSWTLDKHTISFGGEASLDRSYLVSNQNNYGIFTFASSTTARTGNALSDFFYGLPSATNQDAPTSNNVKSWFYGSFIQDDYKALRRLTVNLGLRYDVQTAPDAGGNDAFRPGVQSVIIPTAPIGQLFPGDPGVSQTVLSTKYTHISPRVGFAWDVFGNGKTAFRAASGIFYGMLGDNNAVPKNAPFQERYAFPSNALGTLSNPYLGLPGGVNPFPYTYNPKAPFPVRFSPGAISPVDPNFQWPYTYQYNVSLQQQFGHGFAITVSYVGSSSHGLPGSYDINAPQYITLPGVAPNGGPPTSKNVDLRRPILPGVLTSIALQQTHDRAHYNGMQVSLEKRMSHGLSIKGYYALAKSLDTNEVQGTTITATGAEDFYALNQEYGLAADDIHHQSVSTVVWKPSYFDKSNRLVRGIVDGWSLSSIVTLQSGTPVTVTTGVDTNLDGQTNDRASILPGQSYQPTTPFNRASATSTYFNVGYFCAAGSVVNGVTCPGIGPNGNDGNTRRNGYRGPSLRNVNAALFRSFGIYDRMKLEMRAEVTNVFNLVNLNNPTANLNSTSVGTIRSAATMRQIQLGARLQF